MPFGNTIKQLREKSELTQKDLADKLGLTNSTISKYERNELEPNTEMLLKISE